MKKIVLLLFTTFLLSSFSFCQEKPSKLNRFAIGFNLNRNQNDFGVGINFTSPYIAKSLAFRIESGVYFFQGTSLLDTAEMWSPYFSNRIGVIGRTPIIKDKINVYTEGGMILMIPNINFSSSNIQFGGYGVLGFEFCITQFVVQFIEIGGIGTGAMADKCFGNPIYSNGFMISGGMRFHL